MESLRDIAGYLFKILRYVPCYGGIKQRNLNDDEQEMQAGYGYFTERMKQDSADRMERFIKGVLGL